MNIPWDTLRTRFGCDDVRIAGSHAGTIKVRLEDVRRCQDVEVEAHHRLAEACVVRVSSDSLSPARAASVLAGQDRSERELALGAVPWLTVLAHNDRLRFVSLRPGTDAIAVAEDIVVLSGASIDAATMIGAIERVARVADGLELRATAEDKR